MHSQQEYQLRQSRYAQALSADDLQRADRHVASASPGGAKRASRGHPDRRHGYGLWLIDDLTQDAKDFDEWTSAVTWVEEVRADLIAMGWREAVRLVSRSALTRPRLQR
jgi:hypothetical protein